MGDCIRQVLLGCYGGWKGGCIRQVLLGCYGG